MNYSGSRPTTTATEGEYISVLQIYSYNPTAPLHICACWSWDHAVVDYTLAPYDPTAIRALRCWFGCHQLLWSTVTEFVTSPLGSGRPCPGPRGHFLCFWHSLSAHFGSPSFSCSWWQLPPCDANATLVSTVQTTTFRWWQRRFVVNYFESAGHITSLPVLLVSLIAA